MGKKQKNAAQQEMVRWLSAPQELGRIPAQMECVGTFDMQELRYYIFRFKKELSGKWILGICGGYEGESLEHCGHIFRDEEECGEEDTAKRAAQLVKHVRHRWAAPEKKEEPKKKPGNFVNLVLLENVEWDKENLIKELKEKWKLTFRVKEQKKGNPAPDAENVLVLCYDGATVTVTMIPAKVSGDEIEYGAKKNYTWKNAVAMVRRHCAYLSVEVAHETISAVEGGILLVKTVAACCEQPGVIGVYANGTVYQREQYIHFSGMARAGAFPIQNLIWFGRYNGKKGLCGYTSGLSQFGYDEVEVLNSSASEAELDDFLFALANHIIYHNVVLKHGEVIGFQAWQKLPVTKSRGVAVSGESLKIAFPDAKLAPKTEFSGYEGEG